MLSVLELVAGIAEIAVWILDLMISWRFWAFALPALALAMVVYFAFPDFGAWAAVPVALVGCGCGLIWEIRTKERR